MSRQILHAVGLLALAATACGLFESDDEAARSQLDEEPAAESGPGRIAYVGRDGHIRTVNPDGSGELRISPRTGIYSWPTWSPDGQNLVFSGLTEDAQGQRRPTLFDRDLSTGALERIHVGEPGDAFVATAAPHYVYWSPDSSRLAFLGGTGTSLRLYVYDRRDGGAPRTTMDGVPVFMDWSPDSEQLLIHFENEHFLLDVDQGDLNLLDLQSEAPGYKVPTWKPDTDLMTYVTADRTGDLTLYTGKVGADQMALVDDVPQDAAFRWSPDGKLLAVTSPERVIPYPPLGLFVYARVSLYSEDGTKQETEIEDDVVAFFWSPDSARLAFATLAGQERDVLRWKVLNVANGAVATLIDFIPSPDQLTMLQFFDQFAGSHHIWSPDSRSLVFTGRIGGGAILASTAQEQVDRIIVVAARAFPSTDVIANGTLAFWSPD